MRPSPARARSTFVALVVVFVSSHALLHQAPASAAPSITSFTASPMTIAAGQASTLSWATSGATSVSISPGIGRVATSGSIAVKPAQTTRYTLSASYGWYYRVTRSVTVTVGSSVSQPAISSFTATPASITAGQQSTLSWVTSNATSVTLNGTAVSASGSSQVAPQQSTTYTLSATNSAGTATRQATVTVTAAGDTTAPVIGNGQPTGVLPATTTSATLSVTTNEAATCGWSKTPNTAFSAMTFFSTTGGTSHSTPISGLVPGSYTYYVRCSDASGNTNTTDYAVSFSVQTQQQAGRCDPLPPASGTTVTVNSASALASAVSSATSGTTILVANGTYSGVALAFRTPNVTLRSQSGNRDGVIIDGNYLVNEIVGITAAHVTIADVTIKRAKYHPIHIGGGGHYALLYNLHIVDGGEQDVKVNPNGTAYNDYGTLACSTIEMTAAGRTWVETNSTTISGGYSCYTGGLDAHAAWGWTVRDNLIQNIWCGNGLAEHAIHFWNASRDTVVERNTLVNNARGIGFGLGSSLTITARAYPDNPLAGTGLSATSVHTIGGVIRNNFVFANISQADTAIGLEQAWNASIFHNTVYSTLGGLGIDIRFANSNPVVKNNIATPGIDLRDGGYMSASGGNIAASSGMFVNSSAGNLHLLSTATTAIDKGVSLGGAVTDDIDAEARDAAPDIGADEYKALARLVNAIGIRVRG